MWLNLILLFFCSIAYAENPPTTLYDEGVKQGVVFNFNCTGAGISCTKSGITAALNVGGGGSGSPGGSDTNVQRNSGGSFDGDAGFVYNGTNVGIGSSSPNKRLVVALGANQIAQLNDGANGSGVTMTNGSLLSQSTQFQIATVSTVPMVFRTGATINSMTSGTERIRMNSDGNFGIGTTDPLINLHVRRSGVDGVGPAIVELTATDANNVNDSIGKSFYGLDSANALQDYGSLRFQIDDPTAGTEDSEIQFYQPVAGTSTQVMAIEAGNMGIGTAVPGQKLDARGNIGIGDGTNARLYFNSTITSSNANMFIQPRTGNNTGTVILYPNGTSTTPPAIQLSDANTGAVDGSVHNFFFGTGGNTVPSGAWNISSTINGIANASSWPMNFLVSNSGSGRFAALTVTPSGNVGVGTTVPGNLFQVGSGANIFQAGSTGTIRFGGSSTSLSDNGMSLNNSGAPFVRNNNTTAGSGLLYKGGGSVSSYAAIQSTFAAGTTDSIRFLVGNDGATEAMRIQNNSGTVNVGIGTAIPSSALTVKADYITTKQTAANQACDTTCGAFACIFGGDTAVTFALVDCSDATADVCICSR